jgi:peptidoglycan/LPS O-acetylase OafA/YrhL
MLRNWIPKSSTGRHFDCLDGLRGIAILMVVLYHSDPNSFVPFMNTGRPTGAGWMGVPIFFVLSGFLISYPMFLRSFQGEATPWPPGYALKRVAKIVPPFYLSLVIFLIWYRYLNHQSGLVSLALKWAVGLPNFVLDKRELNSVYWSLIVEVQFYILLPVLFAIFRKLQYRTLGITIFGLMLTVPGLVRYLIWNPDTELATVNFLMARFPCKLDFFGWGVMFAWLFAGKMLAHHTPRRLANVGYAGICLLIVMATAWAHLVRVERIHEHPTLLNLNLFEYVLGLAGFLMLFFVYDPTQWGARLLSNHWLRFTGIISYEWFLFHAPVIRTYESWFGATNGNVLSWANIVFVPALVTYIFSAFIYRYFSLPIMRRLRDKSASKKTPA